MALSLVSLDAVTTTGPGAAIAFHEPKSNLSMQVIMTGEPSSYVVYLEASLDGVNFVKLTAVSPTNSQLINFASCPALYLRANLAVLSGGTSPTCTAIVAAAG